MADLNTVTASILQEMLSAYQGGRDFVLAQAPDVIQQLLAWHFVNSLVQCIVGLIGLIVTIYFTFKRNTWMKDSYFDGMGPQCMVMILPYLGFTILFINFDWIKIWIAPKLFLIEYATHLLKSHT